MSSEDRNPPPPVEVLESDEDIEILEADQIAGTAFSKKWTLATLLKLGKEVDQEQEGKDESETAEAKAHGIDISDDLEKDLCTLWDMSANVQVCRYLEEWNIVDILISIITKSNAPRVVEVSIGILGNMACCPPIAMNFSENKQLRDLVLSTLGSSDAPVLIETTRLLTTNLVSNISAQELWLSAISNEPEVFDKLCFILKSSTNCDLLHAASNLIDTVIDIDEEIMMDWANTILIQAVSEAMKQVKKDKPETVAILLHLVQILSTADTGVETLVECTETVLPLVTDFITSVCERDDVISIKGTENCIASAVSILDVLANTNPPNLDAVLKQNTKTLPNLLQILAAAKDTTPQKPQPRQQETPPSENNTTNSSKRQKTTEDQDVSSTAASGDATAAPQSKSVEKASQDATVPQSEDGPKSSEDETAKPQSEGDKEPSQDATVPQSGDGKDSSQDAPVPQPEGGESSSKGASGDASTTHDASGDDSDMEEIECVGEVTRESNMLTDVLMEFFCNLLENIDGDSSELTTCLKSCNKTHVDVLRQSLTESAPDLIKVLDAAPTG